MNIRQTATAALSALDQQFGWSPGEFPAIDDLRAALEIQPPSMLNVYVTLPAGGEESHIVLPGDVGVDPVGSLFVVYEKNQAGQLTNGKIYAKGQWATAEIDSGVTHTE